MLVYFCGMDYKMLKCKMFLSTGLITEFTNEHGSATEIGLPVADLIKQASARGLTLKDLESVVHEKHNAYWELSITPEWVESIESKFAVKRPVLAIKSGDRYFVSFTHKEARTLFPKSMSIIYPDGKKYLMLSKDNFELLQKYTSTIIW